MVFFDEVFEWDFVQDSFLFFRSFLQDFWLIYLKPCNLQGMEIETSKQLCINNQILTDIQTLRHV